MKGSNIPCLFGNVASCEKSWFKSLKALMHPQGDSPSFEWTLWLCCEARWTAPLCVEETETTLRLQLTQGRQQTLYFPTITCGFSGVEPVTWKPRWLHVLGLNASRVEQRPEQPRKCHNKRPTQIKLKFNSSTYITRETTEMLTLVRQSHVSGQC